MRGLVLALSVCLPAPALAQEPVWPDFATCIDIDIARFERALSARSAAEDLPLDLLSRIGIDHCGTLGITACDLREDQFDCQRAMTEEQDILRDEVLAVLPEPEEGPTWSDQLYAQLWRLARDSSAGPDCAGATEAYEVWCEVRAANRELGVAIQAWQAARMLGRADGAVEAGWANPAPPPQPSPRP